MLFNACRATHPSAMVGVLGAGLYSVPSVIIIIIRRIIMLLKIMTIGNNERVIDKIEDAEIRGGTYHYGSDYQIQDTTNTGPGVFTETGLTPNGVESYDGSLDARLAGCGGGYPLKFVDIKKAGQWIRIAIEGMAYLCNDDGKTISKIEPSQYQPPVGFASGSVG